MHRREVLAQILTLLVFPLSSLVSAKPQEFKKIYSNCGKNVSLHDFKLVRMYELKIGDLFFFNGVLHLYKVSKPPYTKNGIWTVEVEND